MLQHTLRDLRDKVDVMHFDALAKKYRMSRAFNEKDQSFSARFLVHLEKTKQEPEYDAASSMKRRISIQLVSVRASPDARPARCRTTNAILRRAYAGERFPCCHTEGMRDLLLFLLKMALYDREWLFAVIVIFSPFHALRANCSLSRSSLF